jgi:Xaa-Pro aminopeptidase
MNVFGTLFNYQARVDKVRKLIQDQKLDAILVHLWTNQYYLSGMYQPGPWYPIEVCDNTETPLVIFKDEKLEPVFFITYLTGLGLKEGTWIKDVRIIDKEPYGRKVWSEYLADLLKEKHIENGNIGIEEDVCAVSTFKKLRKALPRANFMAVDAMLEKARYIKEPEEIVIIRESVAIAEAGIKAGMDIARTGVLESEVQKAVEIEIKRRGGIKEIESMAQSGNRTANHRSLASYWKKIEENDLVTVDVGCVYKGYGSDLTRTWVVGKPSKSQLKIVDDLRQVREQIIPLIKPGTVIRDIYKTGDDMMAEAGYLTASSVWPTGETGHGHFSIHGIGLSPMHDPPRAYDRDLRLAAGVTLSLSCKARFADFTIRFEDDLLVTSAGSELLSSNLPWKL